MQVQRLSITREIFSYRQILADIERSQQLRPLFDVARRVIEQMSPTMPLNE